MPKGFKVWPNTPSQRQLAQALAGRDLDALTTLLAQAQPGAPQPEGLWVDAIAVAERTTLLGWCLKQCTEWGDQAARLLYAAGAAPFEHYDFPVTRRFEGAAYTSTSRTHSVFQQRFIGDVADAQQWLTETVEGHRPTDLSQDALRAWFMHFNDPALWEKMLPEGSSKIARRMAWDKAHSYARPSGNPTKKAHAKLDWAMDHLVAADPWQARQSLSVAMRRDLQDDALLRSWFREWVPSTRCPLDAERALEQAASVVQGHWPEDLAPLWTALRCGEMAVFKALWQRMKPDLDPAQHEKMQEAVVRTLLHDEHAWAETSSMLKHIQAPAAMVRRRMERTPHLAQSWASKKSWTQTVHFAQGIEKFCGWCAWSHVGVDGLSLLETLCDESQTELTALKQRILPVLAQQLPQAAWQPREGHTRGPLDRLAIRMAPLARQCQALLNARHLKQALPESEGAALAGVRRPRL